ncbi:MAG: triose-phosphate isomerase [Elusimicrobiota bacterium]
MRKPFIAGNWKMNKTNTEAVSTVNSLIEKVGDIKEVDIMISPPYTALSKISEIVGDTNIKLGAQNMHHKKEGAYTGEISALMLKDCGCEWVILGHSERRQYFGCTDELVNVKLKTAVSEGLKAVVCVGETLEQRENEQTFDILKQQITRGLKDLSEKEQSKTTIAYEPVWAIGTGRTATPQQAEQAHKFIRSVLKDLYGREFSQSTRILYGGSIKPHNIVELMNKDNVDGGLVGGASLDAESFSEIIKFDRT